MRHLDLAGRTPALGPGKGPLFVAKQLRFNQGLGDGGAVDRDKGLACACGVVVDGLSKDVFACTGFAQNHDRDVTALHALQFVQNSRDLRIARVQVMQARQAGPSSGRCSGCACCGDGVGRCTGGLVGVDIGLWRRRGGLVQAAEPCVAGFEPRLAKHRNPVVHTQADRLPGRMAQPVMKLRHGLVEQRGKSVRLHGVDRQAQLKLGAAVGRQKAAVQCEHHNAFDQGVEEFRARMKVDAHRIGKHILEHVVLDHLR